MTVLNEKGIKEVWGRYWDYELKKFQSHIPRLYFREAITNLKDILDTISDKDRQIRELEGADNHKVGCKGGNGFSPCTCGAVKEPEVVMEDDITKTKAVGSEHLLICPFLRGGNCTCGVYPQNF